MSLYDRAAIAVSWEQSLSQVNSGAGVGTDAAGMAAPDSDAGWASGAVPFGGDPAIGVLEEADARRGPIFRTAETAAAGLSVADLGPRGAPDMTVNGSRVRDGDGVETNRDIVVHVGSIWDSAGESHTLVSL